MVLKPYQTRAALPHQHVRVPPDVYDLSEGYHYQLGATQRAAFSPGPGTTIDLTGSTLLVPYYGSMQSYGVLAQSEGVRVIGGTFVQKPSWDGVSLIHGIGVGAGTANAVVSGVHCEGFEFTGFMLGGHTNWRVIGCIAVNCGRNGFGVVDYAGARIESCRASGGTGDPGSGIQLEPPSPGASVITVTDCELIACVRGIGIHRQNVDVTIRDCLIGGSTGCDVAGINVLGAVDGLLIEGCTSSDNAYRGIHVLGSSQLGVRILDNTCDDNGDSGIGCARNEGDATEGLLIQGNHVSGNGAFGIRLSEPRKSVCVGNFGSWNASGGVEVEITASDAVENTIDDLLLPEFCMNAFKRIPNAPQLNEYQRHDGEPDDNCYYG